MTSTERSKKFRLIKEEKDPPTPSSERSRKCRANKAVTNDNPILPINKDAKQYEVSFTSN